MDLNGNVLVLLEDWRSNYIKKNIGINIGLQNSNVIVYCNKNISGGENLSIIDGRVSKSKSGIRYTLLRWINILYVLSRYRITEVNWCYLTDDELVMICVFKMVFKRKLLIYAKADSENITLNKSFRFRKYFFTSIDKIFVENKEIESIYRNVLKVPEIISLFNPSFFESKMFFPRNNDIFSGRLLFVGRVSLEKNIIGLTNIYRKYAKHRSKCCLNLILLSDDSNYWSKVDYEIKDLIKSGLEINVYFNPADDLMHKVYVDSDILCITSTNEGVPNVLSDAFYMGLPVLSYRVGNIPNILIDDDLLCDNEDDFVKKIQQFENNNLYKRKRKIYFDIYNEKMSLNCFKRKIYN
jgi:glycosyltransferase involved in cell wall biosynthesis